MSDKETTYPDHEQLLQVIEAFIKADTWAASRHIVDAHPELLSDETNSLLERFITRAYKQNDVEAERIFGEHRDLLRRFREVGIEVAFAEKNELMTVLIAFIETDTWA